MGNHTKIVPKKLTTTSGEHELQETDLFIELLSGDKNLSIEGITHPEVLEQVCLVKSFEIHEFDEKSVVLWQIAEGLMGPGKMWRFGYDDKNIAGKIYKDISNIFLRYALEKKSVLVIVSKAKPGKLTYKEVIIPQ